MLMFIILVVVVIAIIGVVVSNRPGAKRGGEFCIWCGGAHPSAKCQQPNP